MLPSCERTIDGSRAPVVPTLLRRIALPPVQEIPLERVVAARKGRKDLLLSRVVTRKGAGRGGERSECEWNHRRS